MSIACLVVVLALQFLSRVGEDNVPLQKHALVHLAATYVGSFTFLLYYFTCFSHIYCKYESDMISIS